MNIADARFESVESRAGIYRNQRIDIDDVMQSHSMAMACFACSDALRQGIDLLESIDSLDKDWRRLMLRGEVPYDPTHEQRIDKLYKAWLSDSMRVLRAYQVICPEYESRGFDVELANLLAAHVHEIRAASESSEEHFDSQRFVDLRDAAIDEFRGGACENIA